jgi:hypothetical protein
MSSTASDWKIYRTRFLIKAKQLDTPLVFTDPLGREHSGRPGDYLVESSDGLQRIAPREIFEDIYVPMGPAGDSWPSPSEPRRGLLQPPAGAAPHVYSSLPDRNASQHRDAPQPQLSPRRSAVTRTFVA